MRMTRSVILLGILVVWIPVTAAETPSVERLGQGSNTSSFTISRLLDSADVQTELALTDEQKERLKEIQKDKFAAMRKLPRVFDLQELDAEARQERYKQTLSINETAWQSTLIVLTDSQRTRLAQIYLHRLGDRALDLLAVMEDLHLTDEQKARIEAVGTAFQEANKQNPSAPRDASVEEQERQFNESLRRAKQRDADYKAVLTAEQYAAFETMKGKPFTFPEYKFTPSRPVPESLPFRLEIMLITDAEVQKELHFTPAQMQMVATLVEENRKAIDGDPNQNPATPPLKPTDPAYLTQAQKYIEGLHKVLDEKQTRRLTEITIQKRGPTVIREGQIAEQLKLTDEQKTILRRIDFEESGSTPERNEERSKALRNGDRAKLNRMMAEDQQRRVKREKAYLSVLTEEQKAAFEAMQGKKFTFPDPAARLRQLLGREQKSEST